MKDISLLYSSFLKWLTFCETKKKILKKEMLMIENCYIFFLRFDFDGAFYFFKQDAPLHISIEIVGL